ncbi:MAG: hypothetical protein U0T11_02920 [Chitinophagaceae bacterium]
MKRLVFISLFFLAFMLVVTTPSLAQCSICTKTASQLGEKPAAALNTAIIYLMAAPFAIIGFVGWRWWKSQKDSES